MRALFTRHCIVFPLNGDADGIDLKLLIRRGVANNTYKQTRPIVEMVALVASQPSGMRLLTPQM